MFFFWVIYSYHRRISTEMATMPVLVVDEVALRVVKQLAAVKVATEVC